MPDPKANTVLSTDLSAVREVDFVSRFTRDIKILSDMLGSIRLEKRAPGTVLKSKTAVVTLNTSSVGEGIEIPYNKVTYTDVPVGTLEFDKQAIGVTLEAIALHGYEAAVQMADDDMIYRLESKLVTNFMTFAQTGTLTTDQTITDFQLALAEAQGQVQKKWEDMDRGYSQIVGFCNVLDAYRYLGAANISVQTQFGMNYLKDFLGFSKLFLTAKIPSGEVIATPSENIVLAYIDASDSEFSKAGFDFRTDGVQNLIAVHVEGNHKTMTSELTTVTGMGLFAEYLDGIFKVNFHPSVQLGSHEETITVAGTKALTATTNPAGETVTWSSSDTDVATVSSGTVTGVAAGTATITASITVDSKTYTDTCAVTVSAGA